MLHKRSGTIRSPVVSGPELLWTLEQFNIWDSCEILSFAQCLSLSPHFTCVAGETYQNLIGPVRHELIRRASRYNIHHSYFHNILDNYFMPGIGSSKQLDNDNLLITTLRLFYV